MKEKYLYIRTEATAADDDATGDSCCFPLSSFVGATPISDSILNLYFKSMCNFNGDSDGANEVVISDSVQLRLANNNTHKEVMQDLVSFFSSPRDGMLVLVDDQTGEMFSSKVVSANTLAVAGKNS
tara:strand:- start:37789 stop:38166 length:378 start_codon:yes stop_codon:yes gene_type:complete